MRHDLGIIIEAFGQIKETGWNLNNLKWNYYFFNKNKAKLKLLCSKLESEYKFENLYKTDDGSSWVLCVSKKEIHSPESLHRKNLYFNDLIKEYDIELYDGWDVEKVV
ncbi:MAG: ribonuclease E inhibitor RraB [Candidatus Gracilibacteria bacterium]|nr:ribonuclease E inhibitor RraB [Candidatus Gracilibacteria bacterium]MDD3120631.1 ribonuclease E inhibitor RraB [Candidatus Gracilibacteria bacterium]MDD4530654.1 ribonuclease E inhibitor RraB [Candidatus Gracilibacteria bacterium]